MLGVRCGPNPLSQAGVGHLVPSLPHQCALDLWLNDKEPHVPPGFEGSSPGPLPWLPLLLVPNQLPLQSLWRTQNDSLEKCNLSPVSVEFMRALLWLSPCLSPADVVLLYLLSYQHPWVPSTKTFCACLRPEAWETTALWTESSTCQMTGLLEPNNTVAPKLTSYPILLFTKNKVFELLIKLTIIF